MSAVRDALCLLLQADAAGVMSLASDVYPKAAPESATHPFVIVSAQSPPRPVYALGGGSPMIESSVYLVKAVDENLSPARAANLNKLIKARLQNAALTVVDYNLLYLRWVSDVDYAEQRKGKTYQHEGSLWRVEVAPQA